MSFIHRLKVKGLPLDAAKLLVDRPCLCMETSDADMSAGVSHVGKCILRSY